MVHSNGVSQHLSIINERPSILVGPSLLHELVPRLNHDAIAIDFLENGSKRRKFSYKTLHSLSDVLAVRITEILAKLESASSVIPVLLPQSPELYVVLLAILKAGKAFCPLNLDTPIERLRYILADISAGMLITSSSHEELIRAATRIHVVSADREFLGRDDYSLGNIPQSDTNDLAYVLYTSGSTGLPKAVSVSHHAVTQSLLAHDRHIPEFSRFLQFAAPTFDVSIFEIFFPWFRGKTLAGCTRAQMLDDLPGTIGNLHVDAAELTPTVVSNLLNGRSSVPGLKLLLTIGEMLTQRVIDEYGGNASKESILWAMYGPTEAAIHCTLWPHFPTSSSTSTIGHPLDTVSAFVLATSPEQEHSGSVEILPLGEVGELAIGGPQVAKEYLNRPDLTSTSFVEHQTQWLPASMIPSDVCFIDAMPQLPSGKIDRNSLAQTYLHSGSNDAASPAIVDVGDPVSHSILSVVRPHTSQNLRLETKLASAGLDSLKAIRVASALRKKGYELGAIEVLSAATLADLIEVCKTRKAEIVPVGKKRIPSENGTHAVSSHLDLRPTGIAYIIPCTPLQEALLAETRNRPSAYCNWIEVEISVTCTYEDIEHALRRLAQNTEVLRTGFFTESQNATVFSEVVWKELLVSQIREVSSFSRQYLLESDDDFLRPLNIQVMTCLPRPRLLFQIHHALYDGWSFDLLLRDLDKCLRGERLKERPSFQEVIRYYAAGDRPSNYADARGYWATLLSDYIPTPLPNYHGKLTHSSATHRFLGRSTISRNELFERARELSINPQVYFQAATAYVLSLYNGATDVVLGNVTSGRTIPVDGIEDVVGPCIATLPFRINFGDARCVRDILYGTQQLNRESLRYSELPLREIAKAAKIKPGLRLFEALFVWQQSIVSDVNSSLVAKVVDSADELEFRITLEFEPVEEYISFRGTFDASTIPESQIQQLFRQIDEVVRAFMADVDRGVDKINQCFTTPSLSIANPAPIRQRFIHGPSYAVERWALNDPDRTAIIFGHDLNGVMEVKNKATYGVLNSRANQFARVLAEHGVGNDHLVCIIMEKSINLYTSILAILKLGCGYLPLVPDTPVDRVKRILSDAGVTVCVSESSFSPDLRRELSVDLIDFDLTNLADYCDQNLDIPYNGKHLAYAVFTSGSTGTPKGVLVTQDNLMSNLQYLSTVYPYSTDSRLLQACSQAFDVSVFEIFFSWYAGICLCSATKEHLFRDFEAAINHLGVTHLSLTPTVATLVEPRNVPKVRFLVTAGEALTEHVRRRWAGKGLYQGYGPSETTNICTVRSAVTPDDLINNIGAPFSNTSALVLDPETETILPRGAVGELCFGGAQVFRGYLHRPELNAQKIIDHPIYGRIYRSGDMGILLPDDCILSTGRTDDQVKIRGQRVELGETTSVMLDHEAVRDCVTLALHHTNNIQILVSFWVPSTASFNEFRSLEPLEFVAAIRELFDLLSRRLPTYMIPSHLVPISLLPMTPQAKIDKRVLQCLFKSLAEDVLTHTTHSSGIREADQGELSSQWERDVVKILCKVLDAPPNELLRTSSFFNLGLDSVSAIRFCSELRKAKLGDFSVSTVLQNPSIANLASLERSPLSSPKPKAPSAEVTNLFGAEQFQHIRSRFEEAGARVVKILPCTALQEAMISSGMSSTALTYCNVMSFDVRGDSNRLQQCWNTVLHRHEIFRTCFVATDDPRYSFAQFVLQDYEAVWHDHSTEKDLHLRISKIISELMEANKPPLYLALEQGEESTKLLFCCHHALYDGIAISTLLGEIQQLYHGYQLPPPISFEVYLQHMLDQDFSKLDEYWSDLFKDFEPAFFPNVTGKTLATQCNPATSSRSLDIPLETVRKACLANSVSLLSVIQTAWAKLLALYTGQSDVCFGNVVSGRGFPEDGLDRLVAPCFNTLPVRANFNSNTSNRALMDLLHNLNVEMLAYQLTPLRRLLKITSPETSRLFDTLLILQQPTSPLDDSIWKLEQDLGEMDVPVVCEIIQDPLKNTLTLLLHYHTSLLSEFEASIMMETFNALLSSLVETPDSPASDTHMVPSRLWAISNTEARQLEVDLNFLHSGFERIALLHPDRIALEFWHPQGENTTWSFQHLNWEANKIAHALIRAGAGPEDIVPVHIAKRPLYYASILGVLKAGAAFAPVHPELPEARKQLMFTELGPKLVLCCNESLVDKHLTDATVIEVGSLMLSEDSNPVVEGLKNTNLAYCLFTSGSTGVPKAVSMEHHAPIQTIESSRSLVPWTPSSRLLQYAAITFDMCYYDCFLAWTLGFTLCAAEQGDLLDDLPRITNALETDLLDLTPSVAVSLKRVDVPKVKWLYCIGEAMPPAVAKEWGDACVNSYGPTEAAFCTTMSPVSRGGNTSIIGKPFSTTSFAVFPMEGQTPLPVLSVGELYIGGAQLARGYLGKADLTRERFVKRCGQRFYKSGDMVRMLSDGNFEFLGRRDDQVKIRGLRVELGEINSIFEDHDPDVVSVTTQILHKDATARPQLVSFLVLRRSIDPNNMFEFQRRFKKLANSHLPSYMVPQFYLVVDKIPKSMAGKIDRKALTDIFRKCSDATQLTNGVSNASETQWSDIGLEVREVLARLSKTSVHAISPETSIYQLGLDSISAVQVASALRARGHSISATDVLRHTTCEDLADHMGKTLGFKASTIPQFDFKAFEKKHTANLLQDHGIQDNNVLTVRPATPLQNAMISQFLAREGTVYMNYLQLQLVAGLDKRKLKDAWTSAMERHSMLRTGFIHVNDPLSSFAMIEFTQNSASLPWSVAQNDESPPVDQWLRQIQLQAVKELHIPPWAIRIIEKEGHASLDLAIFHALFDAQSLQQMLHDVAAFYHGQTLPRVHSLDEVLSNIMHLSKQANSPEESFWADLGKLASTTRFPNLTPLKCDPEPFSVCVRQSSKSLPELEAGCRRVNTTMQTVGIAGWLSLLSSYTGESSVTCGVVLSGRTFEATEKAVFPCINTVPYACTVSDDRAKMLNSITALNASIQEHQFTPLKDIQRLMGFPNEVLFDTIFAYQKLASDVSQCELWTVRDEKATIEYPISIELEPKNGRLVYRLTYLPHIVPVEQAALILTQLDHLVESFVFHSETSTTMVEYSQLLHSITPPKEEELVSDIKLLHELVESTAKKHPHRNAFEFTSKEHNKECSTKRWTYSELDHEGNKLSHLLAIHGISPGSLVGVCFDKCPEASFAMLGTLKAGCAFVAIDPGAPAARQTFVINDSGAQAVLSMTSQSSGFRNTVNVPVLDLDQVDWSSLPEHKLLYNQISPSDRSYCLYTSGTTGMPKGCELTHENAVQAMLAFQRLFAGHWDANSRWLQFASFHFDVSVLEQYWSWSVGICVVSAPRDLIFEDLAKSIRDLDITHIDLTPSLAQILHPDEVPSLCRGVFITGGESLKQEILDVWGPKSVIYNGYGPTEATIGCTMYPRVPTNGKPSNIGPQFDNVGSLVLRPGSDIPVLRGGVGELCVSGKLVGKGYLNRPDLTAERFPYLERFKERVYRTGDLVRILHDNTFQFLGRADDQVKLRGQRLEVAEINSVIKLSDHGISDVATFVLKHPKQQKEQLVSFLVCGKRSKAQPEVLLGDARELKSAKEVCHDKLPPYMIPTHFVLLTAMPLNVNNKADGRRLRQIYEALSVSELQNSSATSSSSDEPWSKKESDIRNVLLQVLDISQGSTTKNTSFFELGMDSISVIGVAKALKQAGFAEATASTILRYPTVRRLTKALSGSNTVSGSRGSILAAQQSISAIQHRYRREVAETLSIEPSMIEALAPCTPLQQGMIARSVERDEGLYFNSFRFKLHMKINAQKLQEAWERVSTSTQILRTVFVETEEGCVQAVLKGVHSTNIIETSSDDKFLVNHADQLRQSWLDRNRAELRCPVELHLITTQSQKLLILHIFHGLYDGKSIALLMQKFLEFYNGRVLPHSVPSFHTALPHGPLRMVDGAREFWLKQISKNTVALPKLFGESDQDTILVTRTLHGLENFDSIRRKLNVTGQAIVQACWLSVLQEHVKGDVATGIVVSGRSIDLEGADRVIGPMFNTIPHHHRARRSESWSSITKRVHEFNMEAHLYQHTPLRDITKWCKRSPSEPLFDNLLVYEVAQASEKWAKNEIWEILDGDTVADYPLAFEVEQRSDGDLELTLVARKDVADAHIAASFLDQFEGALNQVLEDPSSTLELPVNLGNAAVNTIVVNSKPDHDTNGTPAFWWTDNAVVLREEITALTGNESESINETTSIFELGLDSIDAIKLSSKLKKRGVQLSVSGIMHGLNIRRMVKNIASKDDTIKKSSTRSHLDLYKQKLSTHLGHYVHETDDAIEVLPPTPLQEGMLSEMIASDYMRYYNHDVLRLDPGTDIRKLKEAWTAVVAASPVLRTGFIEVDDPEIDASFAQVIHPHPHDFWSQISSNTVPDFTSIFGKLRDHAIHRAISTPAFHLTFIDVSDQFYLVLSMAHALYDGVSLGLLHDDVHRAYHNDFKARPSYGPALDGILSASGPGAASFWKDYLFGAKSSAFSTEVDAPDATPRVVHRREKDSGVVLNDLQTFARNTNVSLQAVGQTVFALVSASLTGSLDVTFGSVLSGRDNEEISQLMFPTMNTVAVRSILHGTGAEMLRYVQENLTNIKRWQHYPLRKALLQAGVEGKLFDSLFIYQKNLVQGERRNERLYTSVEGHSDVEYSVCVEMEVVQETLVWRCAVKEGVFDSEGAQKLLNQMDEVLRVLMARPEASIMNTDAEGVSVCSLPASKPDDARITRNLEEVDGIPDDGTQDTVTISKIRKVLAAISKIPEDEIAADMTIFHMGLDSISAIKVSSLLRKEDIVLSVGEMLRAGSAEKMAKLVHTRAAESPKDDNNDQAILGVAMKDLDRTDILYRAGIDEKDIADITPVTAGQLYMLSMWLNTKGSNFYADFSYNMSGKKTFNDIRHAWEALLTANPSLRTCFALADDHRTPYVQIVLKEVESTIMDVTELDEDALHILMSSVTHPQPWAKLLVSRTREGWNLRLKIHHALYDGVSLPLLMQQLQDGCNGVAILPSDTTISKFIAPSLSASVLERRRTFWTSYLRNTTTMSLPQPASIPNKKTEIFKPSLLPTASLGTIARRNGVSTQAILLAVYAKLYAELKASKNSEDVVIGIYLANRSLPIKGIASAAIPTLNLLPLRVRMSPQRSTIDIAADMQRDLQDISKPANASTSLYEIYQWTGIKVDTFVNFLSLPDIQDAEKTASDESKITIKPVRQWSNAISRESTIEYGSLEVSSGLVNKRANEAYLHAIDVEATISNGALDVGVFAPTEMLSLQDGEQLLEDLKRELEAL
ncbi:nonribosomal peptide synthetase 2 [Stemphylium lycopersici]|uniref:Nonribosomal peptide synthetase 2 n=1 Tax=Stemphylium lycopersici TaxID=183478 RepID=A0A364NGB0_STELY|nr:nonribosomal peptide synthetase 2 [Stemphylium lycopersici]RAR16296.1 nonribosomal peptide synthetase 2 [Stemphylium lycopersici]